MMLFSAQSIIIMNLKTIIMGKLKQLCFLALFTVLSASCSRMVSTDYEVMQHGMITAVDSVGYNLTVRSLATDSVRIWYVDQLFTDLLSLRGVGYCETIATGDTVYVYRDGGEIFASKCSLADVKDLNKSLCSYYWQNIAEKWYWFLLIFGIIALFMADVIKGDFLCAFALVIGFFLTLGLTGFSGQLEAVPSGVGKITKITADYVALDSNRMVSYATLADLKAHQPVKVGQEVILYSITYVDSRKIFFSSRELNKQAIAASQTYPEIWLKSTLFFCFGIFVMQIPFYYLKRWWDKRKNRN